MVLERLSSLPISTLSWIVLQFHFGCSGFVVFMKRSLVMKFISVLLCLLVSALIHVFITGRTVLSFQGCLNLLEFLRGVPVFQSFFAVLSIFWIFLLIFLYFLFCFNH